MYYNAVLFIARAWNAACRNTTRSKLNVDIFIRTISQTANSDNRISITREIRQEDVNQVIGDINIVFKEQNKASLDRFIKAKQRVWQISHGLDGIGELFDMPEMRKQFAKLLPDGLERANEKQVTYISNLKDA